MRELLGVTKVIAPLDIPTKLVSSRRHVVDGPVHAIRVPWSDAARELGAIIAADVGREWIIGNATWSKREDTHKVVRIGGRRSKVKGSKAFRVLCIVRPELIGFGNDAAESARGEGGRSFSRECGTATIRKTLPNDSNLLITRCGILNETMAVAETAGKDSRKSDENELAIENHRRLRDSSLATLLANFQSGSSPNL